MRSPRRTLLSPALCTLLAAIPGALAIAATAAGCGPAPSATPQQPTAAPRPKGPEIDICEGSKPAPRVYAGILRNVRCDQDMFITMASVAGQLGVECTHCHVQKADDK